jgi:hypothetical protein
MKKIVLASVVVSCLASAAASAQFEGVIDMKITSRQGSGKVQVAMGKGGVRTDIVMGALGMELKMATLVRARQPNRAYQINDAERTYTVIDSKASRAKAARAHQETYTVEKLGWERVLGYECVHVRITGSSGQQAEFWTTKEIGDYASFSRTLGGQSGIQADFDDSLHDAGADGFPVKSIHRGAKGEEVMIELTGVRQQAPPPSTFKVPAGYARKAGAKPDSGSASNPPGGSSLSPEVMKTLEPENPEPPLDKREIVPKMMQQEKTPR